MVKNTLSYLAEMQDMEIIEVYVDLPTSEEDVRRGRNQREERGKEEGGGRREEERVKGE
jgi:hypothetical protein